VAWLALLPGALAAAPSPPPKSIANTAALGFGRFAAAGGGAVRVDQNGVRTRSGAVVLLFSSASAARFTISGIGNDHRAYILSLPPNGTAALRSGTNNMAVTDFTSNAPPGGQLPSGAQEVSVGATLQVAPNQAPGNYAGGFRVTLEYQ
jgi:hypothetical protein